MTLFVKDPQRTYKDLLEELKIRFVSRVVGLDKLRTKHKTFEAKRQLLKEADLFLVDDRVTVEVGKSIGKMWRDAKKCVRSPVARTQVPWKLTSVSHFSRFTGSRYRSRCSARISKPSWNARLPRRT